MSHKIVTEQEASSNLLACPLRGMHWRMDESWKGTNRDEYGGPADKSTQLREAAPAAAQHLLLGETRMPRGGHDYGKHPKGNNEHRVSVQTMSGGESQKMFNLLCNFM